MPFQEGATIPLKLSKLAKLDAPGVLKSQEAPVANRQNFDMPGVSMQAVSTEKVRPLTLQLLEWIVNQPRSHAETVDARRTTCPRLSIREDARVDGLIDCERKGGPIDSLSPKGAALPAAQRRGRAEPPAR